jgi:SAM-dependent methyltransferase
MPGRYSIALLRRGLHVTLFDLAPNLLEIARRKIDLAGLRAEAFIEGDARDLSRLSDRSVDAALVMGPLYHIPDRSDRLKVLSELRRILRPGGRAIIAYLNGWGLVKTGLHDFPERYEDEDFLDKMLEESALGIWHWSNPPLAKAEIGKAGLRILTYAGVEGFLNGFSSLLLELQANRPSAFANLVALALKTNALPQYRDATDHLHFVVEIA